MSNNNNKQMTLIKLFTIVPSVALLVLSLTMNSYYVEDMKESVGSFGLIAFLLGWMNILGAGICWLANPFLFFSWIFQMSGSIRSSLILGVLAMVFSLLFLLFGDIIINEAGQHSAITSYGMGYWLWMASCAVNLIGTFIIFTLMRKQTV